MGESQNALEQSYPWVAQAQELDDMDEGSGWSEDGAAPSQNDSSYFASPNDSSYRASTETSRSVGSEMVAPFARRHQDLSGLPSVLREPVAAPIAACRRLGQVATRRSFQPSQSSAASSIAQVNTSQCPLCTDDDELCPLCTFAAQRQIIVAVIDKAGPDEASFALCSHHLSRIDMVI